MPLINDLFKFALKNRLQQIERFMSNPHEAQTQVFRSLLADGQGTEWGKNFGYADIRSREQFAARVPVSSYEQLFPYIERMMRGEKNVLWATEIACFAKSSGTTNARSKFIPVSKESLRDCHYKGGKDLMALYVRNYPQTKMFSGKGIGVGGSYQTNHLNPNTYYGDVSALLMKNLPFWIEFLRAPSIDIALMDKWEEKLEKMAAVLQNVNVTSMAGVPTWTVVLLQRILERTGKSNICEVWKNLEVFFHGAVAFTPYRALFKKLIPSDQMNYMETYNASEGFFGIQDQKNSEEMLLMLDYGVYYEFIPMEDFNTENPKTIDLQDVMIGKNYALVISTNGGLWRYMIGDTVRFTSLAPYRIKISGRTKHFINAFGEEIVVENADFAIAKACHLTNAVISDYTAAPVYLDAGKRGGHEWVIEFEKMPDSLPVFNSVLDNTLREINSDYDAKRHAELALVAPIIHAAPQGTFYEWLRRKNKLGGQHKVPRLANSRDILEEVLLVFNDN